MNTRNTLFILLLFVVTACSKNLTQDKAEELVISHFPYTVTGVFHGQEDYYSERKWKAWQSQYIVGLNEGVIEMSQFKSTEGIVSKYNVTKILVYIPNGAKYTDHTRTQKRIGRFKNAETYYVDAGTLEFKKITRVFQEEGSNKAEIECELFYSVTPFNHLISQYENVSPFENEAIENDLRSQYVIRHEFAKQATGKEVTIKLTAKKYESGWQLDI